MSQGEINQSDVGAGSYIIVVAEGIKDASGNTYVTGQYSGTAYFNAAQTVSVTTQGGQDVFFAKYDASGNCTWAKGIGGTGSPVRSRGPGGR